jgi:hypothetical protein
VVPYVCGIVEVGMLLNHVVTPSEDVIEKFEHCLLPYVIPKKQNECKLLF